MFLYIYIFYILTDWYGKQKVEKEGIKIKEITKLQNLSTSVNTFHLFLW